MKRNYYPIKRIMSAFHMFILIGLVVASCSKDNDEKLNPEEPQIDISFEDAVAWEFFTINEDGKSVSAVCQYNDSNHNNFIYNDPNRWEGKVVIPSAVIISGKKYSVTTIANNALINCRYITEVKIPESVTSIERGAFKFCESLTSIEIPKSVTDIGELAFGYCSSLTSVKIDNGVKSIGSMTFEGCFSLTSIEIPNSVTNIGGSAFSYCI